jgi:hypothetical protein|tara:strand:+ start:60 stop:485 length:426 start_codon:yes stop_codon:yes gene_type:complete
MKQYYAQPTIRNNWERLHEVYPEARQMTYNNKGFDYLMTNKQGKNVRIEEKWRRKYGKYETTSAQDKIADIFTLLTWEGKYYHMLAEIYHKLARPHSALASGHYEKTSELSQKTFIENATKDLRSLIDEVEHDFGTLEDFF